MGGFSMKRYLTYSSIALTSNILFITLEGSWITTVIERQMQMLIEKVAFDCPDVTELRYLKRHSEETTKKY